MRSHMLGATWGLLAALTGACGDDATGGGGGAEGGGSATATTTTAATTTITTGPGSTATTTGAPGAGGGGGAAGTGGAGGGTGGNPGGGGAGGAAPGCVAIEAVELTFGGSMHLVGTVDPSLGDPDLIDRLLIAHGDADGEHDLTAGFNDTFATCEQCVLLREDVDDEGTPARSYFQSAGTMIVEEAPSGFPYASVALTGVELVEVTIDETGISTPVPGGRCLALADAQVGLDLPGGWTCNPGYYAAGDGCDCACGAVDPDCADPEQRIYNCGPPHLPANGATCGADATCQPPAAWTCEVDQYDDGAVCDCACGAPDLDCADPGAPIPACEEGEQCFGGVCAAPNQNDTCATALALAEGVTEGTWLGSANDYSPGPTNQSSCTGFTASGPDVVYAVSLLAGQTLTATLSSDAGDESLYLITSCAEPSASCVAGADASPNAPETIEHTATADGDFFLIVDQYGQGQQVPFTLTVDVTP